MKKIRHVRKKKPLHHSRPADSKTLDKTVDRVKQELAHMIDVNPQVARLVNRKGVAARTTLGSFCMAVLETVIVAAGIHKPWVSLHARRTGDYAAILARKMGLDEENVGVAKRSGILHDIGKIGIPDSILQKPAPLTRREMEIMKRHVEIGYNLLRSFPFMSEEANTVYAHHERYDGSGYPRGLRGNNIPRIARIVAVADSFDALKFNRAYRGATPLHIVVESIVSGAGSLFDPRVAEAFIQCYRDFEKVPER